MRPKLLCRQAVLLEVKRERMHCWNLEYMKDMSLDLANKIKKFITCIFNSTAAAFRLLCRRKKEARAFRQTEAPAPRLDGRRARVAQLRHRLEQRARQVQLRKAGRRKARALRRLREKPAGAAGPSVRAAPPTRRLCILLQSRPAPARLDLRGVPIAGDGRVAAAAAGRTAPQPALRRRGAAPRSRHRLLAVAAASPAELLVVLVAWPWLILAAAGGIIPANTPIGGALTVALVVQLAG